MIGKLESMETKTYGIFFLKAAEQFSYPQNPMLCQNSNWAWKTVAMLPALAAETIMGPTLAHKYKHTHPRSSIRLKERKPKGNGADEVFETENRNVWTLWIKGVFLSTVHTIVSNILICVLFLRQNPTKSTQWHHLKPIFSAGSVSHYRDTELYSCLWSDGLHLRNEGDGTGIHAEEEQLKSGSLQMYSMKQKMQRLPLPGSI